MRSPPRIIVLSFLVIIAIGTVLLALPEATEDSGSLSFTDALFTATSATCVTGLIVVDTGPAFTTFGELVILILIQIGGLGFMTFSTFFVFLISGKLTFTYREFLVDSFTHNPVGDLKSLLKTVVIFTLFVEFIGFLLLSGRFFETMGFEQALYHGLFHSVSAFCNAGFSLNTFSFMGYQDDVFINSVLIALIILGGLGFFVLLDLYTHRRYLTSGYFRKLSVHSRLVIYSTLLLLGIGFFSFIVLEWGNVLEGTSFSTSVATGFFQSITTRTAGFNTVDIASLTTGTLVIFLALMFIGASPGSCGGGVKNTTFFVLIVAVINRFRYKQDVNIELRRIPDNTVSRAISIFFFSVGIIFLFFFVLLMTENLGGPTVKDRARFLEILFEVVSAYGTVGLSMGLTGTLSVAGKIAISVLMFVGRLGPLTIALATKTKTDEPNYRYIQEDVMVG